MSDRLAEIDAALGEIADAYEYTLGDNALVLDGAYTSDQLRRLADVLDEGTRPENPVPCPTCQQAAYVRDGRPWWTHGPGVCPRCGYSED